MGLLSWIIRDDRRRRRPQARGNRRQGRPRSPYKTAVANLREDLAAVEDRVTRHDAQFSELEERTSDERLEQTVQDAISRSRAQHTPVHTDQVVRPSVELPRHAVAIERQPQPSGQPPAKLQLTPTQLFILETLAADGGDRYLSYRDIGDLIERSPGAVKTHINEMKKKGIQLKAVMSLNNQARYKISSQLKRLLSERRGSTVRAPSQDGVSAD